MKVDARLRAPYVGLVPYSARDSNFFFGRETETEIISANLRAARLTVLYGKSGVGKSSVLQAGVVHNLRQLAAQDVETYGQAEFAVVTYRNWAGDPLKGIANAVREAVADSLGIKAEVLEPVPASDNLVKILQAWSQRYGLELLIILDQFEELFNYFKDKNSPCVRFADQFAEAVKTPNLCVRFVVSLRSDTLSRLDYFKETIPGLFDNRLQLHQLSTSNARSAINNPVTAYNDLYKLAPDSEYHIEPELVDEVIEQIKSKIFANTIEDAITIDGGAPTPVAENPSKTSVETTYLQLVMKRIWHEEVQAGSKTLHLTTLTKKLGGTKRIVQTHLDDVLDKLTAEEREIASKCFKYLVTSTGVKVALTPADLAQYTKRDEEEVKAVLELLIKGKEGNALSPDINLPIDGQEMRIINQPDEARILRTVEIPTDKGRLSGYEVIHDAYIPAIRDWRERYEIKHDISNKIKKSLPYAVAVVTTLLCVYAISLYRVWNEKWAATAELEIAEAKLETVQKSADKIDYLELSAVESSKKENNYNELIQILLNLSGASSPAEKNSAIKKLKTLIEKEKIPEEYENPAIELVAGIDEQKAADLRNAANKMKTNRPVAANSNANAQFQNPDWQIKPRIYIHIVDAVQAKRAASYKKPFEDAGFIVPEADIVTNVRLINTQIRYFRKDDEMWADKAKQLLEDKIKNVRTQYVPGYESSKAMRAKHLELWFAANAFSDPVYQMAK